MQTAAKVDLEHFIIKSLAFLKIFSVRISQFCLWSKGQKMFGENNYYISAYLSKKVLNLCSVDKHTYTHLNRRTGTALKYITEPNSGVPESAKLTIVCTTAQNILLGQEKQQESKQLSEEAIMHSALQYLLSLRQNPILAALCCAHKDWVLSVHQFKYILEFMIVMLHKMKSVRENVHATLLRCSACLLLCVETWLSSHGSSFKRRRERELSDRGKNEIREHWETLELDST